MQFSKLSHCLFSFSSQVHAKATKTELVAREALPEPVEVPVLRLQANRKELGKTFKADQARTQRQTQQCIDGVRL